MNRREFLHQLASLTLISFIPARHAMDVAQQMGERLQESNELVAELEEELDGEAEYRNFWYVKYRQSQERIEMLERKIKNG